MAAVNAFTFNVTPAPKSVSYVQLYDAASIPNTRDKTIPSVVNVTPAAETPLGKNDPVGFDFLDAKNNFMRTNVFAYFPTLQRFEVVYFGAISGAWGARPEGFGPQYVGARAVITNGYRFSSVCRKGGWPEPPVIVTDVIDTDGNEAP